MVAESLADAENERTANALAALARRALTDLPLAALFQEAMPLVAQELAVPQVAVWQLLPGDGALCLGAGVGWREGAVGGAIIAADDLVPEWATLGEPSGVRLARVRPDRRILPQPRQALSAALVALHGDSHAIGVLVAYDQPARVFGATEVAYLREVATILGAAQRRHLAAIALRQATGDLEVLLRPAERSVAAPSVEYPRPATGSLSPDYALPEYATAESLREELRSSRLRAFASMEQRLAERTRQLTAIYAITAKASEPLALDPLLAEVLTLSLDVVGATAGGVQLFDDPHEPPRHVAARGLPEDALAQALGGTAAGAWLLDQNRPLLVRDTTVDPRTAPLGWLPRGRSCALLPLHTRGEIHGLLVVVRDWGRPFTEDEAALLAAIGDQLGVAAERARLFADVERRATLELRRALSRDLHDSLTQSLYSLTLLSEVTARQLRGGDPALVDDYLTQLGATAQQAMKEMRLLIYELRSGSLADETLADALERRFDVVERRAGVAVRLRAEAGDDLAVEVRTELFQIAQEALNNVLKHANATQVTVEVRERDEYLELLIADNGRGFDAAHPPDRGGLGLASMRERAERLGGSLSIAPAIGGGTAVLARLPLARLGRRGVSTLAGVR